MFNTSTIDQPRPRPGQQEFTGYCVPATHREPLFKARNIVCTAALLGLVALAVIAG